MIWEFRVHRSACLVHQNLAGASGLTVTKPNDWYLIVIIERRKCSGYNGRCLLIWVGL